VIYLRLARAGTAMALAMCAVACSSIVVDSDGKRAAVRQERACGPTADGAVKWRLLELRTEGHSTLRVERWRRDGDGAWSADGFALYDPATDVRGAVGAHSRFDALRCEIEGKGVVVDAGVWDSRADDGYHLEMRVDEKLETEIEVIVLG
jgi:hypothetical protein